MRSRCTWVVGSLGILAASALAIGCAGTGAAQRSAAPPGSNATVTVRSASLVVARAETPREADPVMLSCRGGAFCREMQVPAGDTDAIEEANDDCAHRGGTTGHDPCARARIVASCVLSGGVGPISVFTYAQANASDQDDAVSTMSELCETMDGTFALTPSGTAPATAARARPETRGVR